MPENEFEKEVQQKLDGLKLTPGTAVWKSVAARISRKKSRRRAVVFTLILLGCLLSTTLFVTDVRQQYFSAKTDAIHQLSTATTVINSAGKNQIASVEKNEASYKSEREKNGKKILTLINGDKYKEVEQTAKETETAPVSPASTKHKQQKPFAKTYNTKGKKIFFTKSGSVEEIDEVVQGKTDYTMLQPVAESNIAPLTLLTCSNHPADISRLTQAIKKLVPDITADTAAVIKKQPQHYAKEKWRAGIIFSAGQSSTASGYLTSAASSSYADYLNLTAANNPTSNNQFGQNINSPGSPVKITPAAGFVVGISATRKISARSSFIATLTYKLFTTTKVTGGDSLAGGRVFWAVGNTSTYRNQFHFIEIPLTFQTQISHIKSKPVLLEGGVVFSQLISSNALQYDISRNKYYIDNRLFYKTIIGLSAGLSVNLLDKNKPALLIGPQLYYSATPIAASGLYSKTHYSFVGIKLQKMLKKN